MGSSPKSSKTRLLPPACVSVSSCLPSVTGRHASAPPAPLDVVFDEALAVEELAPPAPAVVLAVLETVKRLYGTKLEVYADYFDKVMGTSTVREAFERGEGYAVIATRWETGLAEFGRLRAEFLLYR